MPSKPKGAPARPRSAPSPVPGWVWPVSVLSAGAAIGLVALAASRQKGPALPAGRPSPFLDPIAADALDIEAAARMIASENPRGSEALKREQLYTQIAQAKRHRQSVYERITGGAHYGPQNDVRPVSTDQSATPLDRELARKVLGGSEPAAQFPLARKFFEPAVQNMAFAVGERARGKQKAGEKLTPQETRLLGYRKDADTVRKEWRAEGARPLGTLEGVEFWT